MTGDRDPSAMGDPMSVGDEYSTYDRYLSSAWARSSRLPATPNRPVTQTPQSSTYPYSPVNSQGQPPHEAPKKKGRRFLLGSLVALILIALVMAGWIYIPRLSWEESDYGYTIVERKSVPEEGSWAFTLPFFLPKDLEEQPRNTWANQIDVYSDPELNYPISFLVAHQETSYLAWNKVVFEPSRSELNEWFTPAAVHDTPTLGAEGLWPEGTYYIVERYSWLGKELEVPRVHIYTVEAYEGSLPVLEFTMEVSEFGVPLFEWEEVEWAEAYYIVRKSPRTSQGSDDTRIDIIGVLDGDSSQWYASSQDLDYQNLAQNGEPVSEYNAAFTAFDPDRQVSCQSQDVVYDGDDPPTHNTENYTYPSFSVVSVDGQGNTSFVQFRDGQDIVSQTPSATASRTLERMRNESSAPATFLPESFPVTMGDCRTVFLPTATLAVYSHPDKTNAALVYGAQGTLLTEFIDTAQGGSYSTIVSLGQTHGVSPLYQRLFSQDLVMMTPRQTREYAQDQQIFSTTPASPYTWYGSSEMVTYIAGHLFAGTTAIDMTRFLSPDAPLIVDAANEAYLQNPYITDMFPVVGVINNVLYVDYEMTPIQREQAAERIKTKVDSIVASIITPGMSDREKALAINEYLAKNAVYDQGAYDFSTGSRTRDEYVESFPNAWSATGVLLDGKGVCTSYAAAFQLLAREVGLETMIITGLADNSGMGHAWIKIKLGDRWRVIDPTWNSNIWEQAHGNINRYFGLTDREAPRTEFNAFVVDRYIKDYAAQ